MRFNWGYYTICFSKTFGDQYFINTSIVYISTIWTEMFGIMYDHSGIIALQIVLIKRHYFSPLKRTVIINYI